MTSENNSNKTWREQFFESLQKFCDYVDNYKQSQNALSESIDERLDWYFDNKDYEVAMLGMALQARLNQQLHNMYVHIERGWGMCQSPIERAMALALLIAGGEVAYECNFVDFGPPLTPAGGDGFYIEPQKQIGEFRVDFLLTYLEVVDPIPDHLKHKTPATQKYTVIKKQMVIECDGHAYHERTKEQASNDRHRDRTLQMVGYTVFRFTGSELWENVFNCAYFALKTLKIESMREIVGDQEPFDLGKEAESN